jgi:hypothetical protein
MDCEGTAWVNLAWDKKVCPYEYGNEPSSSLKDERFLDHISIANL